MRLSACGAPSPVTQQTRAAARASGAPVEWAPYVTRFIQLQAQPVTLNLPPRLTHGQ